MVLSTEAPWKERQPDAPQCSVSPLDSLRPRPTDSKDYLRPYEPYAVVGFCVGIGSWMTTNKLLGHPLYTGVHVGLLSGLAVATVAKVFDWARHERHKEKDEMMREYILMHPEDFPPYDRKKYRDLFLPWIPIR